MRGDIIAAHRIARYSDGRLETYREAPGWFSPGTRTDAATGETILRRCHGWGRWAGCPDGAVRCQICRIWPLVRMNYSTSLVDGMHLDLAQVRGAEFGWMSSL
jgi:hypothetical protein